MWFAWWEETAEKIIIQSPSSPEQEAFTLLARWWPVFLLISIAVIVLPFLSYAFFKGATYATNLFFKIVFYTVQWIFIYIAARILEIALWSAVQGNMIELTQNVWGYYLTLQDQLFKHTAISDALHQVSLFLPFFSSSET